MKTKITYNIILGTALFFLYGCEKFIGIDAPRTQIEQSKIFTDDGAATSAATGLYYQIARSNSIFLNGGITVFGGLSSDEITNTTTNVTYDPFVSNMLDPLNFSVNSTFWNFPYAYIFQANAVLEGLNASEQVTVQVKNQLQGEMLFIRSLIYFYLVNLFGDVPLVLTTDFTENELMPRIRKEEIYRQITEDLLSAKQLLANDYPNTGRLRANKMAAASLLARVYLYQSNWEGAAAEASEVINSGIYNITDMDNAFLAGSTEAILQFTMPITQTLITSEGFLFIPSSLTARPGFALTDALLSAFEPDDERRNKWANTRLFGGIEYVYPFKYKTRTVTSGSTRPEYVMVLRLGEQYLIRAEALAQQGRLADAIIDLDIIRHRAGLTGIGETNPQISQAELLDAIYHEKRIEFFAEWGHRWLDLKRTGRIDVVLSENKQNWRPHAALFPIPYDQMLTNPFLTQNEGYN